MILIDKRAGSGDLIEYPPLDEIGKLAILKSGDCSFRGKISKTGEVFIGIEVKRLDDFCSSARSGRLQDQLTKMDDQYHASWVLYYGIYRKQPRGNGILWFRENINKWMPLKIKNWKVPFSYLQSVTIRVSELGVNTFHLSTKADVARWVYQIYRCWQKPPEIQMFMKTFRENPVRIPVSRNARIVPERKDVALMRVAKVAGGLEGINYTLGIRVARKFGSIGEIFNPSNTLKEWMEIDGIGEIQARKIQRQIREEIS